MGRRGNGEGSIRRRKDGRWEGRYTIYTDEGRKQKTVYGKSRKEVAEKLTEAMAGRDKGFVFDAGKLTVGEHLTRWLEDVVKPTASHRTYSTNAQQVRTHIAPTLGRIKLKDLRKAHIDRLYREKLDSGLSPSDTSRVRAQCLRKSLGGRQGRPDPPQPRRSREQTKGQARGDRASRCLPGRSVHQRPRRATASRPSTSCASCVAFGRARRSRSAGRT